MKHLATLFLWVQENASRGGERIRHLDRSSTIKHNLEDGGDHESRIRDGPSWTGTGVLSVAQDEKVLLEYQPVIESVQLYKTNVQFTATFGMKFDPGNLQLVTSSEVAHTNGR